MSASEDYANYWNTEGVKGWENIYEFTARSCYERLRPWFRNYGTALELGCADGVNTKRIVVDFATTVVIDFSPAFIGMTQHNLDWSGNVRYVVSAFEDYEPDPHDLRTDAIFMMHILEHLKDPVSVLKKFKEYLRPDGRIFISVPNAWSLHRRLGVAMGQLECEDALNAQDRFLGHFRVYDQVLLRAHLDAAGLTSGQIQGNFIKPLSARQMNHWSPAILEGLEKLGKQDVALAADLCVAAWPV